jgi:hypothetical protein
MQTLEAIISFSVFMLFTSYVLLQLEDYRGVDDSLYRYQLANDVWRVLYLRGNFEYLQSEQQLDSELNAVDSVTGLCTYVGGQRGTSDYCRGKPALEHVASVEHVLLLNGRAESRTLSLYVVEK